MALFTGAFVVTLSYGKAFDLTSYSTMAYLNKG